MSQLRWGFLGTGWICDVVAADFAGTEMKIQAVGARSLSSAKAFAAKFNIPNVHEGYQALVNDPEVDIIYIGTPNQLHMEHAMLALNAGKHVLMEKPFAINAEQTTKVLELAKAKNLFLMEAMWTRFLPMHDAIFKVIEDGLIGGVMNVMADMGHYMPREENHERLYVKELGGGALLDLGIYPISFIVRALGTPKSITARSINNEEGIDVYSAGIMEFEGGKSAIFQSALAIIGPVSLAVNGTRGYIEVEGRFYEQTSFKVFNNDRKLIHSYDQDVFGTGRQYQALEVERCINAGLLESPRITHANTLEMVGILDQIREQIGVKFEWDK
jgi:predicted dehydrogenase